MKLLIADDHAMFRTAVSDGLGVLLGAGTQVLEAEDYDGVHALLRANPDTEVVLLDLIMPGFANFDGLAALVRDAGFDRLEMIPMTFGIATLTLATRVPAKAG